MHRYFITDPSTQHTTVKRMTARKAEMLRNAGYIVEW